MQLTGLVDRRARSCPDRIAHVSGDRAMTYAELARLARAVSAHVARELPDDRSPVAVIGHKEPEMIAAFVGLLDCGHPYIPVDTASPPGRVQAILDASGASLTLTPEAVASLPDAAAPPPREAQPDDPVYVIFTSGSTGTPKGVTITRRNLEHFVDWMLATHAFADAGEVFLNQATFAFDLSVMDLYSCLATGGTLFSITNEHVANPAALYRALQASGTSVWVSTPTFAQMCLAERTFAQPMLPHLRRFLFCGETLPPDVAAELIARFPNAEVWNTYGPTEATVAVTAIRIDRDVLARYPVLPVGVPMAGTRVAVLDPDGREVTPGESGEIVIAGPNVSAGYLHRPDLTARAFLELDGVRAYRTGDRGHFADGLLFCDGRLDTQVKLHGYRIELGDVEANLRALPDVRDAIVVPVSKNGRADSLRAYVVLRAPTSLSDFELTTLLREQLSARVPLHMVPRRFVPLESFPMTPNGKVDRRRLMESATPAATGATVR